MWTITPDPEVARTHHSAPLQPFNHTTRPSWEWNWAGQAKGWARRAGGGARVAAPDRCCTSSRSRPVWLWDSPLSDGANCVVVNLSATDRIRPTVAMARRGAVVRGRAIRPRRDGSLLAPPEASCRHSSAQRRGGTGGGPARGPGLPRIGRQMLNQGEAAPHARLGGTRADISSVNRDVVLPLTVKDAHGTS